MYDDGVSAKSLPYIISLWEQYDCLKKRVNEDKDKHEYEESNYYTEDKNSDDANLADMFKEYQEYIQYKKDNQSASITYQELEHFMTNVVEVFEEIDNCSRDSLDERTLVKSRIKEIYQMFN